MGSFVISQTLWSGITRLGQDSICPAESLGVGWFLMMAGAFNLIALMSLRSAGFSPHLLLSPQLEWNLRDVILFIYLFNKHPLPPFYLLIIKGTLTLYVHLLLLCLTHMYPL